MSPRRRVRHQRLVAGCAEAAIEKIPPGAIILTVRQPKSWKPIVVSHVGFIVPRRRATPSRFDMPPRFKAGPFATTRWLGTSRRMRWYKRAVEGIAVLMPSSKGPAWSRAAGAYEA